MGERRERRERRRGSVVVELVGFIYGDRSEKVHAA